MDKIRATLPGVEFTNIAADVMKLRMVKSAEEIAFIKNGAQVCDVGGAPGGSRACRCARA